MPFIVEIILEVIVEYVFQIPGAIIRWLFCFGKVPFKKILNDENSVLNTLIGVGIVVLTILIIGLLS